VVALGGNEEKAKDEEALEMGDAEMDPEPVSERPAPE
jgi:hypothetical protein